LVVHETGRIFYNQKTNIMSPIDTKRLSRTRILLTVFVAATTFLMLLWAHFHEGVTTHHVLQQSNMPGISNWLNVLVLPLLTWITIGRVQRRVKINHLTGVGSPWRGIIARSMMGLMLGAAISFSFLHDFQPLLQNVPYVFLLLSFFVPIFFAEFIFGFVLGMVFTFGAVLPTIFMLVLSVAGWAIYKWLRPLFLRLGATLRGSAAK
jgi:hypothetical protein